MNDCLNHNAIFFADDADAFFDAADEVLREARVVSGSKLHVNDPDQHTVGFKAATLGERWRLFCKFVSMALRMLFMGRAGVTFKRRPRKA